MSQALAQMWLQASRDLGIRVVAPFLLDLGEGKAASFPVLVRDFGGDNGIVVFEEWDAAHAGLASGKGFGYSCMKGDVYDRDYAMEVLRDWGWTRPLAEAPSWYAPGVQDG
jgi:hypothetical protein